MTHHDIEGHFVVGLSIVVERGRHKIEVELASIFRGAPHTLSISVKPTEEASSRDFFLVLSDWMDKCRSVKRLRMWAKFKEQNGVFFLGSILFCLALVGLVKALDRAPGVWPEKEQAVELVKKGVPVGKEGDAIRLALALSTDYGKPEPRVVFRFPTKIAIIFAAGLGCTLLLHFAPVTIVGIGKGKAKLARSMQWSRLVIFAIPSLIGGSVIFPLVWEVVAKLWSSGGP